MGSGLMPLPPLADVAGMENKEHPVYAFHEQLKEPCCAYLCPATADVNTVLDCLLDNFVSWNHVTPLHYINPGPSIKFCWRLMGASALPALSVFLSFLRPPSALQDLLD